VIEDIVELAEDVIDALPPEYKDRLDNLAIMVDDEDVSYTKLGHFCGVPLTHRERRVVISAPAEIVLFAHALRRCASEQAASLQAVVQDTMIHELGHYFGLTHAEMGTYIQLP
jgi:predicted Zn-dependent protease with MMP-like domain